MKTSHFIIALLFSAVSGWSQVTPRDAKNSTSHIVGERGPNHRVWQKVVSVTNALGLAITRTNQAYVELATGMHYRKNGQWVESKEEIDILPEGDAAATNGQHQVYFPSDIYGGVIELVTPDTKHLRSRPLGLSYVDGSNSVLIAELTNSTGQILASGNQVIYPSAFTDFKADLRYTYTRAGFEQDIILRERPPAPEQYGLDPSTTRLQVLTEFFSPSQPTVSSRIIPTESGTSLYDETLDFGVMKMGWGRAFMLGNGSQFRGALIGKAWAMLDGRQFLVEEVTVAAIADELKLLPSTRAGLNNIPCRTASKKLALPARRVASNEGRKRIQMASIAASPGLVLDYATINSSQTNYTFQGDTTYYISGGVDLYGASVIEGGTVIKFTNTPSLNFHGALDCRTGPYRPAIFTAKDDNSVGETIAGSTGSPSGYYASYALLFSPPAAAVDLHDIRVAYASSGVSIAFSSQLSHSVRSCQFRDVGHAINCYQGSSLQLQNLLICRSAYEAIAGYNTTFHACHLTVDQASSLLG